MKTLNKVFETMLSKPATPTWTASDVRADAPIVRAGQFDAPTSIWSWDG